MIIFRYAFIREFVGDSMEYENIKKSNVDRVREALNAIDYNHKEGTSVMMGPLSDKEAKEEYMKLLASLPEIPGITEDEIKLLTTEITNKINKIGVYVHPEYNEEKLTNYDEVIAAIERVHYQHRYDAGAMFGTLTVLEATNDYNRILGLLPKIESLTDEQRRELSAVIRTKIGQIPKVEEEKEAERVAAEEEFFNAFQEAKGRFKKLSVFQKIKLSLKGMAPNQIDQVFMTTDDMNNLYRK